MKTPAIPLSRLLPLIAGGCAAWLLAGTAAAQVRLERYYITPVGQDVPHEELVRAVQEVVSPQPDNESRIVLRLHHAAWRINAVAALMEPRQIGRLDQRRWLVRRDVPLYPACETPAGSEWPADAFCLPDPSRAVAGSPPVIYLIDSGVDVLHPEFGGSGGAHLTFLEGMAFGTDYTASPPVPVSPLTDPFDHGTRVAGSLGGASTGLLPSLGIAANLMSVGIYDRNPGTGMPVTYISQAISGILGAVAEHQARRAMPYLKSRPAILVFPHSTSPSTGRFGDLDEVIEIAWREGMHVVLSAGNAGGAAVLVSPAGAAWSLVPPSGPPQRFWFGVPPAGSRFVRAEEEFLVAGAFQPDNAGGMVLWPGTNGNDSLSSAVDVFAPGVNVPTPVTVPAGAIGTSTGTSISAGLTAAVTAWALYQRPWASPPLVRQLVRDAVSLDSGFPKLEVPAVPDVPLTYGEWITLYRPGSSALSPEVDPAGDPDGDGQPNFLEYFFGLDPRYRDAGPWPEISVAREDGNVVCRVSMPIAPWLGNEPQVAWRIERSTDGLNWSPARLDEAAPREPAEAVGDGWMWDARITVPPVAGREFFRLRISANIPPL